MITRKGMKNRRSETELETKNLSKGDTMKNNIVFIVSITGSIELLGRIERTAHETEKLQRKFSFPAWEVLTQNERELYKIKGNRNIGFVQPSSYEKVEAGSLDKEIVEALLLVRLEEKQLQSERIAEALNNTLNRRQQAINAV